MKRILAGFVVAGTLLLATGIAQADDHEYGYYCYPLQRYTAPEDCVSGLGSTSSPRVRPEPAPEKVSRPPSTEAERAASQVLTGQQAPAPAPTALPTAEVQPQRIDLVIRHELTAAPVTVIQYPVAPPVAPQGATFIQPPQAGDGGLLPAD